MKLPFRTAVLTTPTVAHPSEGAADFERVEDTITAARTAPAADARLRMWINHPDERVPLALTSGSLAEWIARHENWSLHLYARAMRDADRDGVCWTPLLDRLAVSGIWPAQKGRVVLGGKVAVVTPQPVTQVIEPLKRWLRDQTDGTSLVPLALFEAPPVRALIQSRLAVLPAVASFTGEYPSQRVEAMPAELRVVEMGVGTVAIAQPTSPQTTPQSSRLSSPQSSPQRSPQSSPQDTPQNAPQRSPISTATAAATTAAALAAATAATSPMASATPLAASPAAPDGTTTAAIRGPVASPQSAATPSLTAPPPMSSATTAAAPTPAAPLQTQTTFGPHGVAENASTSWMSALLAPPAPPPADDRRYTPEQVGVLLSVAAGATGRTDESQVQPDTRKAINTLIEYRALPSEKLYSLYSACRLVKTWVVRIVAHVSATIELWRAALRDNNWIEVREAIVRSTAARRDSVIRLILSRSGSPDVLCALCLDGDMADVPQIARRVRGVNPLGLLEALTVAVRTTGLRLTAMDLSPLVHHDNPEVRQRTLGLLHLMVRPA